MITTFPTCCADWSSFSACTGSKGPKSTLKISENLILTWVLVESLEFMLNVTPSREAAGKCDSTQRRSTIPELTTPEPPEPPANTPQPAQNLYLGTHSLTLLRTQLLRFSSFSSTAACMTAQQSNYVTAKQCTSTTTKTEHHSTR